MKYNAFIHANSTFGEIITERYPVLRRLFGSGPGLRRCWLLTATHGEAANGSTIVRYCHDGVTVLVREVARGGMVLESLNDAGLAEIAANMMCEDFQ